MTFPLPHQPYPTRTLAIDESNLLRRFTNSLTAAALHDYDYDCFVKDCNGDVTQDTRHDWQLVKRRDGLNIYRDNAVDATHRDSVTMVEENGRVSSFESSAPGQIQALLCVGTISGTLDDVMHGVASPTAEDTMLKSSCIGDNLVDCCVLASIVSPTSQDPWRSLTLKWAVNAGPVAVRPFVRARDFTYVESTGTTTSIDGERVGYHIIHSVVVPATQKLEDHALVRGNVSLYHVYRQKSPTTVEVHVRAFWQLNGRMRPAVQTYACVESTIAVARVRMCSQMRKLAQLGHSSRSLDSEMDPSCCSLCRRWVGGCFTADKSCAVCQRVICRHCGTSKKLSTVTPHTRQVVTKRQTVCRRCQRKSDESVVVQEPKPAKRSKALSTALRQFTLKN
ncbi:hypothetical protein PF004_g4323 [Phytophthora fragariae]|uniref:FYVE-type domain-containing protein n=2 Tax=Phytophthora fragariae TaxID=53985 RepID=A0A6G0PIX1_9STRA|nr:hypothetical protein PF004_g4323 [Phytophthora fragariae]